MDYFVNIATLWKNYWEVYRIDGQRH